MILINKKIDIDNLSLNSEVTVLLDLIQDTDNYLDIIDSKGCEISIENESIVIKDPNKKEKEDSIKDAVTSSINDFISNKFSFNSLINTLSKTSSIIDTVDKKFVKLRYFTNNSSNIVLNGNKFLLNLKNTKSPLIINANDINIGINNSNISGSIDSNKCKIKSKNFNLSGNLSVISNKLVLNINCNKNSMLSVFLHANKNNLIVNDRYLNNSSSNILRLNVNKISGYIDESKILSASP